MSQQDSFWLNSGGRFPLVWEMTKKVLFCFSVFPFCCFISIPFCYVTVSFQLTATWIDGQFIHLTLLIFETPLDFSKG